MHSSISKNSCPCAFYEVIGLQTVVHSAMSKYLFKSILRSGFIQHFLFDFLLPSLVSL